MWKDTQLNRKYYKYDIKCNCCNGEFDNHFEIIKYCNNCEPKPPEKISVNIKPIAI